MSDVEPSIKRIIIPTTLKAKCCEKEVFLLHAFFCMKIGNPIYCNYHKVLSRESSNI